MRTDELLFDLPPELIASTPLAERDASRLLVLRREGGTLTDDVIRSLPSLLPDGALLVVNDTRVIPARLRLRRHTGGAAEVLLLDPLDTENRVWEAMVRGARKMQAGEALEANGVPLVRIERRSDAGDTMVVSLIGEGNPLEVLQRHGEMPLPPYITAPLARPDRYQTVYANEPGSSAAPTAGLHFTPALLGALEAMGVQIARVELVVGLDTFKPVSAADPRKHQIHSERYRVPSATTEAVHEAKRVVAVGTTSVRALESAATSGEAEGRTRLFIHRPYEWKTVDLMLTNFHLPRTTLLMMIDAFVGPRWRGLYDAALQGGYRFLSFGDAMLLDRSLN